MPFTWRINIAKTETGYTYAPNPLDQVAEGDEIIWSNADTVPHWPGLLNADNTINTTYFMPNQIAAESPSTTFVPSAVGTLTFVDSLDTSESPLKGSIVVSTLTAVRTVTAVLFLALSCLFPVFASAQTPAPVACLPTLQPLLVMPEIGSKGTGKLQGTIKLTSTMRTIWGFTGDPRCATQDLRMLQGTTATNPQPWPTTSEPLPGPTLRARVGDLVEITFMNQVDVTKFAASLDHGAVGTAQACDVYTSGGSGGGAAGGDVMPNCLHGSSTSNLHFHGTHTTPSTTGDNILMFVRPALRVSGMVAPSDTTVKRIFAPVFTQCEQSGPPATWGAMPAGYQAMQQGLLQLYDTTAVYQGVRGALPDSMQLWPANEHQISQGLWPQFALGAYPYCFPLPAYDSTKMRMGQSPGTHWYHAHKHGSTALNVANGLTGVFIIEGQYDDQIRKGYNNKITEQVLMIQQIASTPFPLTNPQYNTGPPGAPRPQISVNGRLNPVVSMARGEVQWWRVVNGGFRDAVQFSYFEKQNSAPCTAAPPATSPVTWRQISQDGVQLDVANYKTFGVLNNQFNLSPANRADLLVKAPADSGSYSLCIVRNSGIPVQPGAAGQPEAPSVLMTVKVGSATNNMAFLPDSLFPTMPSFLRDIPDSAIVASRTLVFGGGFNKINNASFQDSLINQTMTLNTAEEWTVSNQANDKAHPFHIHINPFQITELFEPNAPEALDTSSTNPCYVNPNKPETWKPCPSRQPKAPFVWWDTFGIPTGQQYTLTCTKLADCPAQLQPYITCTTAGVCTQFIAGYFKMRSRFVDWTGQYVLHCHILIHEDRGMMQLIQVVPSKSGYGHH